MSLKARFSVILGLVLTLFLGALFWQQTLNRRHAAAIVQSIYQDRTELLDRVITLVGSSLETFADDYSLWNDMIAFSRKPDKAWAAVNIDASLPTFNAVGAWVFHPDGRLAYTAANLPGAEAELAALFSPADVLAITAREKQPHFFVEIPAGLLEVRGAPLQQENDFERESPPQGWFFVARRWDEKFLQVLAHLNESDYRITRPGEAPAFPASALQIHVQHVLRDARGEPFRVLHLSYHADKLNSIATLDEGESVLFVVYGVLTFALVVVALVYWVLRPLHLVSESLADENPRSIQPLLGRGDEFGRVARLIETATDQRAALQNMLAERGRLGRDLHDSVIQRIYACGMGVTSARLTLRRDPAASEATLQQIGAQLNDVIHDLRGFITGLEPEVLRQRTFREAIEGVLENFRSAGAVEITLRFDDSARLRPGQQLHLLHIVRECVSNALRHGRATAIAVNLSEEGNTAVVTVRDDGCGFQPDAPPRTGKGLANLAERTRELAGALSIESAPGGPTCVRVTIPLTPSLP
jgi:signal transduction histidine kinase